MANLTAPPSTIVDEILSAERQRRLSAQVKRERAEHRADELRKAYEHARINRELAYEQARVDGEQARVERELVCKKARVDREQARVDRELKAELATELARAERELIVARIDAQWGLHYVLHEDEAPPPTSDCALPTQVGAPPTRSSDSALPPQVGAHPATFDSAIVQVVHPQPLTALQPTPVLAPTAPTSAMPAQAGLPQPTATLDVALPAQAGAPPQVGTPPTPVTDARVAPSEEESSCETNHEASGGPSRQRGGPPSNTSVAKHTVGHEEENFDEGKQLNKSELFHI